MRAAGGPLDPALASVRERLEKTHGAPVSTGQVLTKWLLQKDAVVVTYALPRRFEREYNTIFAARAPNRAEFKSSSIPRMFPTSRSRKSRPSRKRVRSCTRGPSCTGCLESRQGKKIRMSNQYCIVPVSSTVSSTRIITTNHQNLCTVSRVSRIILLSSSGGYNRMVLLSIPQVLRAALDRKSYQISWT